MAVDAENLSYPVIAFSGDYFEIRRSSQELTTNCLGAIRAGHFDRMTVVDRRGKAYRVAKVIVPRIGLVRNLLNPLVGQVIRVQVELEETAKPWDVEKVRAAVRRGVQGVGRVGVTR